MFSKLIETMVTKRKDKKKDSVPILCISVNVPIDTMLKFDPSIDPDVKCERILIIFQNACSKIIKHFPEHTSMIILQEWKIVLYV